jgi:hypothetical protein
MKPTILILFLLLLLGCNQSSINPNEKLKTKGIIYVEAFEPTNEIILKNSTNEYDVIVYEEL